MIKSQTSKNLFTNSFTLVINVAMGLFYTPYLVRSLGIIAYGIVPLALIINQYISVLTGSLTASLTRFYTIALQKGEPDEASKYMSTALSTILMMVIVLLPLSYLIVSNINHVFNIPHEFVNNARFLFAFTLLSFFVSLFSSLLNSTLYATNRLDLMNVVNVVRTTSKVLFTVVFFQSFNTNIEYIGIANLLTELFVFILSIYFFKDSTNSSIKINLLKYFDKKKLIAVLSMTSWVLVYQLGDTGLYRVDIILVNIYWGTKESGILGALSNLGTYLTNIVGIFSSLFGPLVLIAYSKDDHEEVKRIIKNNTMLAGLFTAGFVGLLMGFSKDITCQWLGKEYSPYSIWLSIKLLPLPFFVAGGMFAFLFRSWNLVRLPSIITICFSAINMLVMLFIFNTGHSIYTITVALFISAIIIILQTYFFGIWYTKKIYSEIGYTVFARSTVSIFVTISILFILGKVYSFYIHIASNLFGLLLSLFIVGLIGAIIMWYFIIPGQQKEYLISEVFNK